MNAFAEVPQGRRGPIIPTGGLPVEGSVELDLPLDDLWRTFLDVGGWHRWNPCIWRASVSDGRLAENATLVWAFNPIAPRYLYKLPAVATIVATNNRRSIRLTALRTGSSSRKSDCCITSFAAITSAIACATIG